MAGLSISRAWDESKAVIRRDGRLIVSVALAMIALPTAITGLIDPSGMAGASANGWTKALLPIASLLALAGQLSLIRLALSPSITVGDAIVHGLKRMPVYLLAAILILAGLAVLAIPFALVMTLLGVPIDAAEKQLSPEVATIVLLFMAVVLFACVRMLMSGPVASGEGAGPLNIVRRSWQMTAGHWWQLFGFLMLFFVGAILAMVAVGTATGALATLLLGPVEPMSASALVVALVEAAANAAITALFAVMLARIYVQLAGSEAQPSVPRSGI
ncbi:MAG TPA: hypothetical protein VM145_01080 [Sphingomicrobium sp.]|nr:hypothetical protein [Sphingomicrobium sp.]